LDEDENPRVAIKALKGSGNDFKTIAEGEAKVLEMMRGYRNEHLIKAIAYYRRGENYYFMFPWAEMGNLADFWKHTIPNTEPGYITWVFTQLKGLTNAIEELHHDMVSNTDKNCRHGDLKPLNILCFKTKDGPGNQPRLVITDVGLAKVYNEATDWRTAHTRSTAATARYAAPELGIDAHARKSRRFDIWSMGCIFLEFVIWVLYGDEKLQGFKSKEPFYVLKVQDKPSRNLEVKSEKMIADLHPTVRDWITYIEDKDWRCSGGSAIQRLVELIKTRMLEVKVDNVSPAKDTHLGIPLAGEPSSIAETRVPITNKPLTEEPDSDSETTLPIIKEPPLEKPGATSRAAVQHREKQTTYDIPKVQKRSFIADSPPNLDYRAYAPEVRKKLQAILDDLKSGEIKTIGPRPRDGTGTPPGPKTFVKSSGNEGGLTATFRVG